MKELYDKKHKVVIGVDASTRAIAVSVVKSGKPAGMYYIKLPHGDLYHRLSSVRRKFEVLLKKIEPTVCLIEAPILIQNPLATKHMAYLVGILMGECLENNIKVEDVSPMTWKSFLGYKPIKKAEKQEIQKKFGSKAREEMRRIRKGQVQEILTSKYPRIKSALKNDDLADSLGIALYAWHLYGAND